MNLLNRPDMITDGGRLQAEAEAETSGLSTTCQPVCVRGVGDAIVAGGALESTHAPGLAVEDEERQSSGSCAGQSSARESTAVCRCRG